MKISVTSCGPGLNDRVDERLGRSPYFVIVDTATMKFETIQNPYITVGSGAGIQSAQLMINKGVTAVLTGNCGPNAFHVFKASGIHVFSGVDGIVQDAVQQFKSHKLIFSSGPNVQDHFGMRNSGGKRIIPLEVRMKCDECNAFIPDGEGRTRYGRNLCEDCYLDLLSPAKACDPWAVFCAKQAEKNLRGEQQLKPVQKEILTLLRREGPMEPATLSGRLQITTADMERELATLRHMEKIGGELKNGIRLIRLWETTSPEYYL